MKDINDLLQYEYLLYLHINTLQDNLVKVDH
jgi:hypothetical protein